MLLHTVLQLDPIITAGAASLGLSLVLSVWKLCAAVSVRGRR